LLWGSDTPFRGDKVSNERDTSRPTWVDVPVKTIPAFRHQPAPMYKEYLDSATTPRETSTTEEGHYRERIVNVDVNSIRPKCPF